MKKSLIFAGMLVVGFANAQYEGKVGVNTETPKATLEIQPTTTNLSGTTNEGIIAPKLSKERIAAIATPVEGTLVYATDATYTGSDSKVAKITEKGYYYYDGTVWVKSSTGENDQLWAQRDNSGITETYLKPATEVGDEFYFTSEGKFRNIDNPSVQIPVFNSRIMQEETGVVNSENKNYTKVDVSSIKIPSTVTANTWGSLFANANNYTSFFDAVPDRATDFNNINNHIYVPTALSSLNSLKYIKGINNIIQYHSPATLTNLTGQETNSVLGVNSVATALYGTRSLATTYSTQTINTVRGDETYAYLRGTGSISNALGRTTYLVFQNASTSTVTNAYGNVIYLRNWQNSTPTITNARGLVIDSFREITSESATMPTIENHMGLYINNIEGGTASNYSIYTNAGAVRLGDLKGTGNRPVYADADGKLIIGDATNAATSFKWVEDATNTSVKLAVTSAGVERTDNPVSITDTGLVKATSFQGSNGATIFPDYVFQKYYDGVSDIKADYTFKSLSQVEDFVKANGHLPGYKSAAEIKNQGYIDLMETQLTNVEKIEELYLHSIEQEKTNKVQAEELKAKDAKIQELEARLEKLEKLLK